MVENNPIDWQVQNAVNEEEKMEDADAPATFMIDTTVNANAKNVAAAQNPV